jgi:hypothetical protein
MSETVKLSVFSIVFPFVLAGSLASAFTPPEALARRASSRARRA